MPTQYMTFTTYKAKASDDALVYQAPIIKFCKFNTCWKALRFGITENRTHDQIFDRLSSQSELQLFLIWEIVLFENIIK